MNKINNYLKNQQLTITMPEKQEILEILKQVTDPELGVDIISLGLVYDIKIEGAKVIVVMTLTSPMGPYGPELMDDVKRNACSVDGVKECEIELTFSPPWNHDKMSEEAKIALGIN